MLRTVLLGGVALSVLLLLGACNRQPTDLFLPIIIGEATAPPIILDTPALPTAIGTVAAPTATASPLALPSARPTIRVTPGPATRVPTASPILIRTPAVEQGRGTPVARSRTPSGVAIILPTPVTVVRTPTPTATRIFRNYLALILSQFQQRGPATATTTPSATLASPAPTVLVVAPATATPLPTSVSALPTATPTPTALPTRIDGTIQLWPRDPVIDAGIIPAVAYADPTNLLAKDWSSFYVRHPENSTFVRIYAHDQSRIYGPARALTSTEQWVEGVCMAPSSMVGVQFWGDENDGWARVTVGGVEYWRGNTYGPSLDLFVRFLEIRDLPPAPHVVRVEPLGKAGTNLPGGNDHVSVYAIVCGLPVTTEIYVPILQR